MEKIDPKAPSPRVIMRSKEAIQCQLKKLNERSEIRSSLASKISEMTALHEAVFEDQCRLVQENIKLNHELSKLKEENAETITKKDKEIEELKKEVAKQCEKLEHNINEIESLVRKTKELESKNKEILEKDNKMNKQICELQERLVTKDKIIIMKTKLVKNKHKDIVLLKEKTEQLLHIYEKSMKDKLKVISEMCTDICAQSSSIIQEEEAETTV